jgi:hypothetical protein
MRKIGWKTRDGVGREEGAEERENREEEGLENRKRLW